jgi:predicted PurR-regulated permease PerM
VPVALSSAVFGWKTMLLSIAVVFIVQEIENMIISPKIFGDKLSIHPLYIIVAIIAASGLLGLIGILFALPALIILRETVQFLFRRKLYDGRNIEKV